MPINEPRGNAEIRRTDSAPAKRHASGSAGTAVRWTGGTNRRTVVLGALLTALLAVWWWPEAPTGPGPTAAPTADAAPAAARPTPPELTDGAFERNLRRLADPARRPPGPAAGGRNPFGFAPEAPNPPPRDPGGIRTGVFGAAASRPGTAAIAGAGSGPTVELSGIAAENTPSGTERTAVLSIDGVVVLAREGDDIGGGYRAGIVGEDSAELIGPGGTRFLLTLR